MSKKTIQLVACTIQPKSFLREVSLKQIAFPDDWFEPLLALQAECSNRLGQPVTLPTQSLNAILQALIPHLLVAPQWVRRQNEPTDEDMDSRERKRLPWLLTQEAVPKDLFWHIIQAWLKETYGECESFPELEHLLSPDDLSWHDVTLSLGEKTCENGTADIPKLAFKTIPVLIANMLTARRVSLPIGLQERPLVRVPVAEGAELMTWPPVYHVDKHDEEATPYGYSYTVNITLQTLVGQAEPRIHFCYGVRRWQSTSCFDGSKLYLKRRTSVYLRSKKRSHGELDTNNTAPFTIATIEAIKGQEAQRFPLWTNLLPNIARRVNIAVPSAEELTRDPQAWLAGTDGVEAGIVCSSSSHHPVGTGIGPDVSEAITTILMTKLSSDLSLCPLCKPYDIPSKPVRHAFMRDLREFEAEERLAALEKSVGPQITIEVRWQTEAVRDMLVDRLIALLTKLRPPLLSPDEMKKMLQEGTTYSEDEHDGSEEEPFEELSTTNNEEGEETNQPSRRPPRKRAPEPAPQPALAQQIIPLPAGGQLHIIVQPLAGLGDPLPKPDKQKKQTMHTNTNQRAKKIKEEIAPASGPTLTFIELPDYRTPELRRQFYQRDPKRALRLGMAHTGRVTQFLTSEPSDVRQRCESAVRDGLRQLGYLPCPIGFTMPRLTLPDPLLVVGIWFIRITRRRAAVGVHLPVIVMLHTAHHQVKVWLPHDGCIRPYSQALLDIVHLNPEKVKKHEREDALNQIRHFLLREITKQGVEDVVVFTVAQNARSTWPGLNNTEILSDALRFERSERPFPSQDMLGKFRLIRLRTSLRDETPEWYVPNSKPGTTAQGIWTEHDASKENRLFYSIGAKPHTAPKKYIGKQHKPQENYKLSTILETLPIVLPEGEDPALWAVAVDQWRKMGFLTNDMTLLPLPLELARKMDEYAAVIGPWVFPHEWEEDEDEEATSEEKGDMFVTE